MKTRILALAIGVVSAVCAQQGRIGGPVSGYLFDGASHGVRPILGIPGAALLGQPLDLGFETAVASVSPRLDSLIAVSADGQTHLFRIDSGAAAERFCDGLIGAPERIFFSPSGSAAALYKAGALQIVTGLPDAPAVARTLDAGSPAAVAALALSDDGSAVLASGDGSLRLAGGSGQFNVLAGFGDAVMAFAPGTHDAAAVDRGSNQITLFRDVAGNSESFVLAGPQEGVEAPVGVAFSVDGARVFVAGAGARAVLAFNLADGGRQSVDCGCKPTGIFRLGSVYRLTEIGAEPLWLLDAQGGEARTVFVPVAE